MSWEHRVVRRRIETFGEPSDWFGIHEAFYTDEGTLWTDEPISVEGETVGELRETLERMLRCLDKPIIDGTKINPLR